MSSNPVLNVGIIGFGEMGKRHALEYHNATRGKMKFPAVVEPEEGRYEEGCKWYGHRPRRYTSIGKMLETESLDALIIASPNHLHLENLRSCTGSNLPLMLEKPLESSFENICTLVRTARAYNKPIMVDHVMRYAPIIRKAKDIITAGGIGKVCSFNFVQYHGGQALFSTFRRTMAGGGGQLIEKATHDLDTAFYLCGAAPRSVSGVSRLQKFGGDKPEALTCSDCDEIGCANRLVVGESSNAAVKDIDLSHDLCPFSSVADVSDNEMCIVECSGNVFGTYSHCYFVNNHFSRRYEIIGTEGLLYIELSMREKIYDFDGRITVARASSLPGLPGIEEHKFNYQNRIHYNGGPFAGCHFYDMIRGEAEPFTTVEDAFAAEMTGIAAMKSSSERRWIDIENDVVPRDLRPAFRDAYKPD